MDCASSAHDQMVLQHQLQLPLPLLLLQRAYSCSACGATEERGAAVVRRDAAGAVQEPRRVMGERWECGEVKAEEEGRLAVLEWAMR